MTPEGTYNAKVMASEVTKSASSGNPQMCVDIEVTHVLNQAGDNWDVLDPVLNKTIYLSLTDKAWPFTKTRLESMKFNGDWRAPQFGCNEEGLVVECRHDSYKGEMKERWEVPGEMERIPVDDNVLLQLKSRWDNETAAVPASAPAPPPPAPQAEVPAPPPAG